MTRKLAVLNWLLGAILLGLVFYVSQMDPLPPSEEDPGGYKVIRFLVFVFAIGAVFSFAIGMGLWFRSTGLWRTTFWIAILAAGFFGLLSVILIMFSYLGPVYLPLLGSFAVPLISAIHLGDRICWRKAEDTSARRPI